MKFFYITNSLCTECGRCEETCPTSAIFRSGDGRRISYDKCTSCGNCMKSCDSAAVTIETLESVLQDMERVEVYKERIQRLENELSSTKDDLSSAMSMFRDTLLNLPLAALVCDRFENIVFANREMSEILDLDPVILSQAAENLSGESLESVVPEEVLRALRLSTPEISGLFNVFEIGGRKILLSASRFTGGGMVVFLRDVDNPGVVGEEIIRRLQETIDRKMSMVQQIGFLLGEEVSVFVNNLNSVIGIIESTSGGKDIKVSE